MSRRGVTAMSFDFKLLGQSAVLTTPNSCYVFGPKEGIQRDLTHARIPIQSISHVFLSDRQTSSGIFGLLMTNSVSDKHTSIFSYNMVDYIRGMSIFTENVPRVTVHDFLRSDLTNDILKRPDVKDIRFKGRAHERITAPQPQIELNRELTHFEDSLLQVFPMFIKKGLNKKRKINNYDTEVDSTVVSYLVHLPTFRGKIDAKKIEKLKIPKEDINKVVNGNAYLIGKKKITLDMISSAPRLGRIILILNCPSLEYVDTLISHPYMDLYSEQIKNRDIIAVHVTPKDVYLSVAYQQLIRKTNQFIHHHCDTASMTGLPFYQQQLNALNKKCNYFTPATGLDWNGGFVDYTVYPELKKFEAEYQSLPTSKPLEPTTNEEPSLPVFTSYGVGSAIPQVTRNVSGYCLTYNGNRYIFDAGEDTLRSILMSVRHSGLTDDENNALEMAYWNSVKFIYISHGHADHHSGLQPILTRWSKFTTHQKLNLIVTPKIYNWLNEIKKMFEFIDFDRIQLSMSSWYTPTEFHNDSSLTNFDFNRVNVKQRDSILKGLKVHLETAPVNHPGQANACKLIVDGFTFVYGGDTAYSPNLVKLAMYCDLLVHEATFEDYDAINARKKRHSTLAIAIRTYNESKAKNMIITHFSQKFKQQHPVSYLHACKEYDYKIIPAQDGLSIPISDHHFKQYGQVLKDTNDIIQHTMATSKQQPIVKELKVTRIIQ